jgi:hypothetical protein
LSRFHLTQSGDRSAGAANPNMVGGSVSRSGLSIAFAIGLPIIPLAREPASEACLDEMGPWPQFHPAQLG